VLEHVDGEDAVEEAIGEIEALLAVADHRAHSGEAAADLRGHVLAVLVAVIVLFLLGRQALVLQVLAETGPDLERGAETGGRVADGDGVVEALDHAVARAAGEFLVPDAHELVVALLLFRRERGQDLGPPGRGGGGHGARI
jgi:hypothetical protein